LENQCFLLIRLRVANSRITAKLFDFVLRFLYVEMYYWPFHLREMPRLKRGRGLRGVLSRTEVLRLLRAARGVRKVTVNPIFKGEDMQGLQVFKSPLLIFRSRFYTCAAYSFLMGILMTLFPERVTKNAGVQHPKIPGILRGIGGSMLDSTVFYILIALRTF
jgi:hypothetical protein